MAVATPVLERKINTQDDTEYSREIRRDTDMSADERHNSKISSNYAKLINPESTLNDIIERKQESVQAKPQLLMPVHEEHVQKPYLVENARADADIFRADSLINRKYETKTSVLSATVEEDENEDLRPTQTTIQYKTAGIKRANESGKIENAGSTKRRLAKKEKIIIAAVISVVIALFVLIIINSAIISSVSNEINYLQSSLETAKVTYSEINDEMSAYLSNLSETVGEFAKSNGMVLR